MVLSNTLSKLNLDVVKISKYKNVLLSQHIIPNLEIDHVPARYLRVDRARA